MNVDSSKSYATQENLMKALEKMDLLRFRPVVVRNKEGRWMAIFGYSLSQHQNPASICHLGFMVIN